MLLSWQPRRLVLCSMDVRATFSSPIPLGGRLVIPVAPHPRRTDESKLDCVLCCDATGRPAVLMVSAGVRDHAQAVRSLTLSLAHSLMREAAGPVRGGRVAGPCPPSRWDAQAQAPCAEGVATVRQHLWGALSTPPSARAPDLRAIPRADRYRRAHTVCDAH
jgi:hypothetical protein